MTKLSVIVHANDEVTLRDERGVPVICKDCRFAGWLTEYEFQENTLPRTCLHYSGGANPEGGDRVRFGRVTEAWKHTDIMINWREHYPLGEVKNAQGDCNDFVRAKPVSWWRRIFGRRKMRE